MKITRRQAMNRGLVALAAAGDSRGFLSWLAERLSPSDAPADVFAGDAPAAEVWERWKARGWIAEARHYLKLDGNVQCKVCPNNCLLKPGDRSHCRNKVNRDGVLYTMAFANPCTFHVDPIEKKPLFHFLPGTTSFSLATSGCVFRCLNCQNWEISQKKPEETKDPRGDELRLRAPVPQRLSLSDMERLSLFPDDLPGVVKQLGCPSVSYTYSEPTAYYEYTAACCQAVRARGLKNVVVTCGSIEPRALADLLPFVDAAHVDLKGFDEEVYRKLNSGRLAPILETLKAYRAAGVWFEVIHLVVPTYTDRLDTIRRMCDWLAQHLGPDTPLHFSRFSPKHKLSHLAPTPIDILVRAREAARTAGLRYVYLGNVTQPDDAQTTFCPGCGKAVVKRDVFTVTELHVERGRCRFCKQPLAGVWST